ncbi:hypothetical protein [Candidatus Epulonipiscium viviparus]|uniref:hypothetical protein n=1 Tax=Candidatus Epulonipiscium viviparus TaxID=420336 RepID=UPI0027381383|nr:hypothetical protein [Candidatus Epulopiscium viviparus]
MTNNFKIKYTTVNKEQLQKLVTYIINNIKIDAVASTFEHLLAKLNRITANKALANQEATTSASENTASIPVATTSF